MRISILVSFLCVVVSVFCAPPIPIPNPKTPSTSEAKTPLAPITMNSKLKLTEQFEIPFSTFCDIDGDWPENYGFFEDETQFLAPIPKPSLRQFCILELSDKSTHTLIQWMKTHHLEQKFFNMIEKEILQTLYTFSQITKSIPHPPIPIILTQFTQRSYTFHQVFQTANEDLTNKFMMVLNMPIEKASDVYQSFIDANHKFYEYMISFHEHIGDVEWQIEASKKMCEYYGPVRKNIKYLIQSRL